MKKQILLGMVIIVAAIIASSLITTHFVKKNLNNNWEDVLTDTIHHFDVIIADKDLHIYSQKQQYASLQQAYAANLVTKKELQERNLTQVSTIIRLKNEIKYKDQLLAYKPDTVYKYDTIVHDAATYLRVPMPFLSFFDGGWAMISGKVLSKGVNIEELTISQEPTIILGYKNNGYFKRPTPVVTYSDANPAIKTVEMSNVQIQPKPPFYKTEWWYRGEGAVATLALMFLFNSL